MERWIPATIEDVLRAIDEVAQHAGPETWPSYARKLVAPYPAMIERFGELGEVFVVARMPARIVFFEDIEGEFGTATEVDGKLIDCANYSDLRLCLKEAEVGG